MKFTYGIKIWWCSFICYNRKKSRTTELSPFMPLKKTVSVIIPARNEESFLPPCIAALQSASQFANCSLEIIVVLNRCTDKTEEIANELGCITVRCDKKNLSAIRNVGVSKANSEWIATLDADSIVCPHIFKSIHQALENPKTVGGGVMIYPSRYSPGIILTGLLLLPIVLRYGISGGMFFFRKDDFQRIGGFDENLVSIEDIDFAIRLKALGKSDNRTFRTLWKTYITTSTRKFDHFGDWYFLLRPHLLWRLFRGTDRDASNIIWYDFKR